MSFSGGRFGSNVIISGVDVSSSIHVDNKKKDIFFLGKSVMQGLEHTITAEKCIELVLRWLRRNFVQACIKMEQIVIYMLMQLHYV